MFGSATTATFLAAFLAVPASATFVYEGFDHTSGVADNTAIGGLASTGVGVDAAWTKTLDGTIAYKTDGLALGLLDTAGGRLQVSDLPPNGQGYAQLGLDTALSGTVYGSFLTRVETAAAEGRSARVAIFGDPGNDGAPGKYAFGPDRFNLLQQPGGRLNGTVSGGTSWQTAAGSATTVGETYLTLFELTNVGGTNVAQGLTMWVLTQDQFANFKAGGLNASELNAASVDSTATAVYNRMSLSLPSNSNDLSTNDALGVFGFHQGYAASFDEFRLSDESLDAVTPLVPEPSAFVLAATGATLLLPRRRR